MSPCPWSSSRYGAPRVASVRAQLPTRFDVLSLQATGSSVQLFFSLPLLHGMASASGIPPAMSALDVAIRAAVQAGAPRRTVAATAAAVASVVMAELRCGGGATSGAAASPSAAKRRRTKRKKKAEKERLAATPPDLPAGEAAGRTSEGSGVGITQAPAAAGAVPGQAEELPPPLASVPEDLPRTQCMSCRVNFASRSALFRHLRESDHGDPYAQGFGNDDSISERSAGSKGSRASNSQQQRPLAAQGEQPALQLRPPSAAVGGAGGPVRSPTAAMAPSGPSSAGPAEPRRQPRPNC